MSQLVPSLTRNWLFADVARDRWAKFAIFALTVFVMLLYVSGSNPPPYFCCDAEHYWNLGDTFFKSGHFSLYDFDPTFRGYALPLILGSIRFVARSIHIDEFRAFHVFNAVVTASALIYVLPSLGGKVFAKTITVASVSLIVLLFVVFWGGYLIYPLSDTWSFFLIAFAALAAIRSLDTHTSKSLLLLGVTAGFAVGLCLNIRPIYALSLPIFIVAIFLTTPVAIGKKLALMSTVIGGCIIALAPQMLLNLAQLGTINPLSHSGSLYVLQVFMGTAVQRHECAYFIDTAGVSLLASSGITVLHPAANGASYFDVSIADRSLLEYIKMVINHPLDFLALYIRHIFNGITVLRDNIYACIYRPYDIAISLLSLLTAGISLGLIFTVPQVARQANYKWFVLSTVAPLLVIVPTAIEGRFFFPAQIWFYMTLAFVVLRPSVAEMLRGRLVAFIAITCLIFGMGVVQLANVQSSKFAWLGIEAERVKLQAAPQLITQ